MVWVARRTNSLGHMAPNRKDDLGYSHEAKYISWKQNHPPIEAQELHKPKSMDVLIREDQKVAFRHNFSTAHSTTRSFAKGRA